MAKIPSPQYTLEQAISVALALATRALDEIEALKRQPGPRGEKGDPGEKGERGESGLSCKDDFYQGVWNAEGKYARGQAVTWDGSFWIAMKDDAAGKPGRCDDWRLAVKKGRDGKDGKSIVGPQGPAGKDGRDGVQLGPDGKRW